MAGQGIPDGVPSIELYGLSNGVVVHQSVAVPEAAFTALLAERDALSNLAQAVDDAMTNYERIGEIWPFEGNPMI